MKVLRIINVIVLALAIGVTSYILYSLQENPFTNRDMSEKAVASVVSTGEVEDENAMTVNVSIGDDINIKQPGETILSFTTDTGEEAEAVFPWYFTAVPEDNQVEIIYLVDDPAQVTLDSYFFHSMGIIFMGVTAFMLYSFGVALLILNIIVYIYHKKNEEKGEY